MRPIPVALALLALSACAELEPGPVGPQGPAGPVGPAMGSPIESGTRIKKRIGTTPDGAKLFLGWHDAELGVDCEFVPTFDGSTRCLPVAPWASTSTLFSDSACSRRVALAGANESKYVLNVKDGWVNWRSTYLYTALRFTGEVETGPVYAMNGSDCELQHESKNYASAELCALEEFAGFAVTLD